MYKKRTKYNIWASIAAIGLCSMYSAGSMLLVQIVRAESVSWDGGAGTTSWCDALNWSTDTVPTSADDVTINTAVTVVVTGCANGAVSFQSLTLGGASAAILALYPVKVGSAGSITIASSGVLTMYSTVVLTLSGNLTVQSGGTLNHAANTTAKSHIIDITAASVDIQSGASVNASSRGYTGGYNANGNGLGGGSGTAAGGAGGGHGGNGSAPSASYTGGVGYCNLDSVDTLGSGGGGFGGSGVGAGSGGGLIRLAASGTISINGALSSVGQNSPGFSRAGGAGGGIYLSADTISGTPTTFSVAGGNGNATTGGAGGGGCVSIHYTTSNSITSGTVNVKGGVIGTVTAGPGLLYIKKTTDTYGDLYSVGASYTTLGTTAIADSITVNSFIFSYTTANIIAGKTLGFPTGVSSPLDGAGPSAVLSISGTLDASDMTEIKGVSVQVLSGGVYHNNSSLTLVSSGAGLIFRAGSTVSNPLSSINQTVAGTFAVEAAASHNISSATDITIEGTMQMGSYTTATTLNVGTLTIKSGGNFNHYANTNAQSHVINISAENIDIQSGGSINVDGRGYANAVGNNGAGRGTGAGGGGNGSTGGGGGAGYGGVGGAGTVGAGGAVYCNTSTVSTIGSSGGGNGNSSDSGEGGGLIWLTVSGTLTINGTITADGTQGGAPHAGSGSGGGIKINANQITGTPTSFTATGGAVKSNGGGGGGGCVQIIYVTSNSLTTGDVSVAAGTGTVARQGAAGVLYMAQLISNTPPVVIVSSTGQIVGSSSVVVAFTISDADANETGVTIEYSEDGSNWDLATVEIDSSDPSDNETVSGLGNIDSIPTNIDGSVDMVVRWRTDTDLADQTYDDVVYLRITPYDTEENGDTVVSGSFVVDIADPTSVGNVDIVSVSTSSAVFGRPSPTSSDPSFDTYVLFLSQVTPVDTDGASFWSSNQDMHLSHENWDGNTQTTVTGLTPNTRYYAVWVVRDMYGNTTVSEDEVSLYTYANPPINVVVTDTTTSSISLSWDANDNPGGTVYVVSSSLGVATTTNTSYQLTGLIDNTFYEVEVWAINGNDVITEVQTESSTTDLYNYNPVVTVTSTQENTAAVVLTISAGDWNVRTVPDMVVTHTLQYSLNGTSGPWYTVILSDLESVSGGVVDWVNGYTLVQSYGTTVGTPTSPSLYSFEVTWDVSSLGSIDDDILLRITSMDPHGGETVTDVDVGVDRIAPTVLSFTPENNSNNEETTNFILSFSEAVFAGSGSMHIYRSTGVLEQSISVASGEFTGWGTSLITLNPSTDLTDNIVYYVYIDSGVFVDEKGNEHAGISSSVTWTFKVGDTVAPTLVSRSPSHDPNNQVVDPTTDIVLTFSENVVSVSGFVSIYLYSNDSLVESIAVTDTGKVSGSGTSVITISPSTTLLERTKYYILVDSTAFDDLVENSFSGITSKNSWVFSTTDVTNPVVVSVTPEDNETGVSASTNLFILFSETVEKGSGTILIKESGTNVTAETISVSSGAVSISGSTVTITPSNGTFVDSKSYYVLIDTGVFTDTFDNEFAGISSETVWNFSIEDISSPEVSSISPVAGATGISPTTNIQLTFDESVVAGAGSIEIYRMDDDSLVETIAASTVSFLGTVVTINPSVVLDDVTMYYVLIQTTAFLDNSSNYFSGVSNTSTIYFTTADTTDPTMQSLYPVSGSTTVSPAIPTLTITFDETVYKGSGTITIHRVSDGGIVQSLSVSSAVSVSANEASITLSGSLTDMTAYYITIPNTAFRDSSHNYYDGFSTSVIWNFTTEDMTDPTLVSVSPSAGATGISPHANVVLEFSEDVGAGLGSIFIYRASDDELIATIAASSTSISGDTVTIDPGIVFTDLTEYYVLVESTAFMDTSQNSFFGVSSSSTIRFTTGDTTAPAVVGRTPVHESTDISTTSSLSIEFNESVQKGSGSLQIKRVSDGAIVQTISVGGSGVSISGTLVTIALSSTLSDTTEYYVVVPNTAFRDSSNNYFSGYTTASGWRFTTADTTGPELDTVDPVAGETGVSLTSNITLVFTENIVMGAGVISIYRMNDDLLVETIAVTSTSILNNTVTVSGISLADLTEYYVLIDSGAYEDVSGNSFVGVYTSSTIYFTTKDTVPPELVSISPSNIATNVGVNSVFVATFDSTVTKGTGNIRFYRKSNDTIFATISVNSGQVTVLNDTVTIDPTVTLEDYTEYYIRIDNTAIKDIYGNNFAGITNGSVWNFRTSDLNGPTISSRTPADNATGVATSTVTMTFNEEVVPVSNKYIRVRRSTDNVELTAVDVTSSTLVYVSSTFVSVTIPDSFQEETGYYILIDEGAFVDVHGNMFSGISSVSTWNFTVGDNTAPTVSSKTPVHNTTLVSPTTSFTIVFTEAVYPNTGKYIRIRKVSDNSEVGTYHVTGDQVLVSGTTVLVTTGITLADMTQYYVIVESGAFEDGAGNLFSGYTNTSDWRFTTTDTAAPMLLSFSPASESVGISPSAQLVLTFNENIIKGDGYISIYSSTGTVVSAIHVDDNSVVITGNTVTVDVNGVLVGLTGYYILVDAGTFVDIYNNYFAGISNNSTWTFETADVTAQYSNYTPVVSSFIVEQDDIDSILITINAGDFNALLLPGIEITHTYTFSTTSASGPWETVTFGGIESNVLDGALSVNDPINGTITQVLGSTVGTPESPSTFSFVMDWDIGADLGAYDGTVYVRVVTDDGHGGTVTSSDSLSIDTTIPSAPTDLTIDSVVTTSMALSWTDTSDNETSFVLEYIEGDDTGDFPGTTTTIAADSTSATILGLDPNTQYTVRIAAVNANGTSAYATSTATYTATNPPVFVYANKTTSSVEVGFTTADGGYSPLADLTNLTTDLTVTSTDGLFTLTDLSPNITYELVGRIYNADGVPSATSTTGILVTYAEPPTIVTVSDITDDAVTLSWDDSGATQYKVYDTTDGDETLIASLAVTSTTLSDLVCDSDYTMVVTGHNQLDEASLTSTTVSFVTSACPEEEEEEEESPRRGGASVLILQKPNFGSIVGTDIDALTQAITVHKNRPTTTVRRVRVHIPAYIDSSEVAISTSASFDGTQYKTIPKNRIIVVTLPKGYGKKELYIKLRTATGGTAVVKKEIVYEKRKTPVSVSTSVVGQTTPTVSTPIQQTTFVSFLSRGSQGVEVIALQRLLQRLGYFPSTIAPNGVYGPSTEESVRAFQRANGIDPLGYVGPGTRAVLNAL